MLLSARFQAFIEQSPVSVMMAGLVERIFHAERLDQVFAENAVQGSSGTHSFLTDFDVTEHDFFFGIALVLGRCLGTGLD